MTTLQVFTLKSMTYSETDAEKVLAVVERITSLGCAALAPTRRAASACRARIFGALAPELKSMTFRA